MSGKEQNIILSVGWLDLQSINQTLSLNLPRDFLQVHFTEEVERWELGMYCPKVGERILIKVRLSSQLS